jgi:ATP-dependent Clp protease adapter protein ClpS
MLETIERDNETIRISAIEGVNMQSLHDYMVRAYNNSTTDGMSVVNVLMHECGYSEEQSINYTLKIHHLGQAVIFWGTKSGCESLVGAFAKISVQSEVLKNE